MKIIRTRRMADKIRFVCAVAVLLLMMVWVATIFAAVANAADKGSKIPNINLAGEWVREVESEDGKAIKIVYNFSQINKGNEGRIRVVVNSSGSITISHFKYSVVNIGDDLLLIFYNNRNKWGARIIAADDSNLFLEEIGENINSSELLELSEILIYKRISY